MPYINQHQTLINTADPLMPYKNQDVTICCAEWVICLGTKRQSELQALGPVTVRCSLADLLQFWGIGGGMLVSHT